jgi:peroxiredoxin
LPLENKALRVGDRAPDFTLTDAGSGEAVSLGDLLGQPLFLSFGRGTW